MARRVVGVGAPAGLALYALLLVRANSFVAGGSDSSGYLNEARLLARGKVAEEVAALSLLGLSARNQQMFTPLGYRPAARPGAMAPTYPPGLPLHMAVLGTVGGWRAAPFLVGPLAAVAAVLIFYAVARELGLSRGLAAAGSVVLAVCLIFLGLAVQPMSDVPATAWVLAAILFALRARRRESWALAAGAALGVAVLVRPTNVLAALAFCFALPPRRSAFVRSFLGGLPLAAFLFVYDHAAFGSAASTGYGGMLTWTMSPENVLPEIRHYGFWLPVLLTPLVPLCWMAVAFDRRASRPVRALLFAWFGAFFAFYCFYEPYEDWWSVRFLLPGIPAMILATLFVARDLPLASRSKRVVGVILLAGVVAVAVVHIGRFRILSMYRGEVVYRDASRGAARFVPPRSLIAAMQMSGALKYYTGLPILRWDRVPPDRFADLRRRATERGVALYAVLWPFELEEFAKRLPAEWESIGRWGDAVLYGVRSSPDTSD